MEEQYDFYRRILSETCTYMTEGNQAYISDLCTLVARINKAARPLFATSTQIWQTHLDRARAQVASALRDKKRMAKDLSDFKQNHTLEAYFRRFKHIPEKERRDQLLKDLDTFLNEEPTFENFLASDGNDQASGAEGYLQNLLLGMNAH